MSGYTKDYFSQEDVWKETLLTYQKHVLDDILALLPPGIKTILDVGCGNGHITNALPETIKVVGLDASKEALKHVRREKVIGDITALPFKDSSFDLVMANDVIEHLEDAERKRGLNELARVAAKYIIITVPFLEDLNNGAVKCSKCGRFYHINHHKKSFGLEELGNLFNFSDFNCHTQIISGDTWHSDPSDIVVLKRMLQLQSAQNDFCMCPRCGGSSVEIKKNSQLTSPIVNRLATRMLIGNNKLIDTCTIRTECINLYSKEGDFVFEGVKFIDSNRDEVFLEHRLVNTNTVELSDSDLFKREFLPTYSRIPYFVHDTVNSDGALLSKEKRLLLGFFCEKLSDDIKLTIAGCAKEKCTLTVYPYKDHTGYLNPSVIGIEENFEVEITLSNIEISTYGLLFEIKTTGSSVTIRFATIHDVSYDTVTIYDNKMCNARFMRLSSPGNAYLSLPIYGRYLIEQEWMKNQEILNKRYGLNIINTRHDKIAIVLEYITELADYNAKKHNQEHNLIREELRVMQDKFNSLDVQYQHLIKNFAELEIIKTGTKSEYVGLCNRINGPQDNIGVIGNRQNETYESLADLQNKYVSLERAIASLRTEYGVLINEYRAHKIAFASTFGQRFKKLINLTVKKFWRE